MQLRFYKEDGLWYYDAPPDFFQGGGTKGNRLMVANADVLLENLCTNGYSVVIDMQLEEPETYHGWLRNTGIGVDKKMLEEVGHPIVEHGGYYDLMQQQEGCVYSVALSIWLCPTLLFVTGGFYPDNIYFTVLEAEEKQYWYVDIPQWFGEISDDMSYRNVAQFSSKTEAIAFAKEAFGADNEGKVPLVT